uniref:Intraflagellar transport-associated protein n=1 Tax=Sciurus vulgaris TaxID=55149 RepID=A0A8D2DGS2_SCIVU
MPAQTLGLEIMDEDQLMEKVLDKFVNCHEQTYEEFRSTFTHLSKEDNVIKRRAFGTDSSGKIFTSVKFTHNNEPNDHHLRNTTVFHHTSSQCLEEEQVDNFLDLEDLDMDEDIKPQMNKDFLLLPGEVEEDVSNSVCSYSPSVDQPLTAEVKPKPGVKGTQKQAEEILGDEVQPFSLDEEFDYDNVALTPKFTAEEMETIRELLKQERRNTNTYD